MQKGFPHSPLPSKADPPMRPVFDPTSRCLAKKYLTPSCLKALGHLKTDTGFSLETAIASGIKNPDSHIGLYAGDSQSYTVFARLFDPVIQDYHGISADQVHHSDLNPVDLPSPDPEGRFILSTRVRVARSLRAFNFPCHIRSDERKRLETTIVQSLSRLDNDLCGTYISMEQNDLQDISRLKKDGLIFEKGDRFQAAAGINRDFPESRGVFCSNDRKFRVWVNEEDHLRIISMEPSPDLSGVFNRLVRGITRLQDTMEFAENARYGNLNSCPTNIGTAMRAGVHIRLKGLENDPDILNRIAEDHDLQIRGTRGEKTAVNDAVFDISNRRRLGLSETDIVTRLFSGIRELITAEKSKLKN